MGWKDGKRQSECMYPCSSKCLSGRPDEPLASDGVVRGTVVRSQLPPRVGAGRPVASLVCSAPSLLAPSLISSQQPAASSEQRSVTGLGELGV